MVLARRGTAKKLGLTVLLFLMALSLSTTPAHALDLFPDIDVIPDPNLEDLNDIPDPGPGYGGGKHRRDTDGDGIPDRNDLNPSAFGGAADDARLHRRHRHDDDGGPNEDQYADASQYADVSQYDPQTGGVEEARPQADDGKPKTAKPKDAKADREPERDEKVDTEPASAGDGGGWLGTVVGVFVVLWLVGAVFGK
jgi:hypothetical protein